MSKLILPEYSENNVLPFARPSTGGSGPPISGRNWLNKIEVDSLFLVKDSYNKSAMLVPFHLVSLTEVSAQLYNPDTKLRWWDIEDFSTQFKFQEVLGKVLDNDIGSLQPSSVDDNVATEILDTVVQDE